jgi:hypothetical protein
MNVCAKCGFENNTNVKKCTNCLTDLQWAKANLGKFHGNTGDTRKIGIESRKEHGIPVPEDEITPLEAIQTIDNNENDIISDTFLKMGQFILGFLGYIIIVTILNILVFAVINSLIEETIRFQSFILILVLIIIQLIGIGLTIRNFGSKMRWLGIGIFCAILPFILGAILVSGCMPPLLLPFPLSLMSAC